MIPKVLSTPLSIASYIHDIILAKVNGCVIAGVDPNNAKKAVVSEFSRDFSSGRIETSESLYELGLRLIEVSNPYKAAELIIKHNS